jgi:ribosomal protein S18 acetylase RimI-like enzyme
MPILERITADNVFVFKAVRLAALKDSPSAFGSTYAKESRFSDADWLKRVTTWTSVRAIGYLAMDSGTACGIAAGFLDEHDPIKAHLVSMWVAPEHRRCGIGQTLIAAIVDWTRDHGVQELHLMVTCSNTVAIKFYERLGFSMTGYTEPYPNDVSVVEYEMSRPIAAVS